MKTTAANTGATWKTSVPAHSVLVATTTLHHVKATQVAHSHVKTMTGFSGLKVINESYLRYESYKMSHSGITSWGESECGGINPKPTVFTNVDFYQQWIYSNIENNIQCD